MTTFSRGRPESPVSVVVAHRVSDELPRRRRATAGPRPAAPRDPRARHPRYTNSAYSLHIS